MNTTTSVNFPFFDLPFNIKTQILARLPVETLLKCRAVCKFWRACIESPSFISKHRDLYNKEHSKNSHLLLFETSRRFRLDLYTYGQKITTLALRPRYSAEFSVIPWIYGTCNGLSLLRLYGEQKGMYLFNAFLRKSLILPPSPFATPFQSTKYILGFSPICDDYKVLVYRLKSDEYKPAMAVYSLKNHIWTIKNNPMNADAWSSLKAPVHRNKYTYCGCGWIVYWFPQCYYPKIIHSFDFNTEEFNNVAVPEPLKECKTSYLFAMGKLLAVISSSSIWVMEKHDGEYTWRKWCSESWVKTVYDVMAEHNPFGSKFFFVEQSNVFVIIGWWGCIHVYDVRSRKLQMWRSRNSRFLSVGAYVETLALLTGTEGMIFKPFS
ncbi:unnamed protein product [Amaranthus hypochondriacus]